MKTERNVRCEPEPKKYCVRKKTGMYCLSTDWSTVLYYSGAIKSNYIDEQFVNNNIVHLQQFLQPLWHSVKLGDNTTQLQLTHIITIPVSFIDGALKCHEATILLPLALYLTARKNVFNQWGISDMLACDWLSLNKAVDFLPFDVCTN